MKRSKVLLAAAFLCVLAVSKTWGYVDLSPTLPRIVRESQTITIAEITAFSQERGAVILKKVRDLKGETGSDPLKHELLRAGDTAIDLPIAEWAEPGRRCIVFATGKAAVVCVGEGWYQVQRLDNGWWRNAASRPDLPLAYYGSISRLEKALPLILEGKPAIITTVPHGANREGASFDLALQRGNWPGLVKVQRLRVAKGMPEMAMGVGSNPAWVVGPGRVGKEELPVFRDRLRSEDAATRADSAADLGYLGADAGDAVADLVKLLDDKSATVRVSAAAALLRIKSEQGQAVKVLIAGLADPSASTRRHTARSIGLAGAAAEPLADRLGPLLEDVDIGVRRCALQAIATLGPAAIRSREGVTALLDRLETAVDAADALGRMGSAARPSMKALASLLENKAPAQQWAAVRAMSQIGGEDAAPAVKFMINRLPNAGEADSYNMLIYLSLLGPVAKDAIPAVRNARIKNPVLRQMTVWAIDPGTELPNMGGPEFAHYILEAYVQELGDHLKPAALTLAKKITAGNAGNVPDLGYKLLARFPEETLAILTPGLSDAKLVIRERSTAAIGFMGLPARAARPQVAQALKSSTDEREQLLLQWCLRELGQENAK
jgi:HEAT repeat protein